MIRYEVEATSKLVGGVTLRYAVSGQDYGVQHDNVPIAADQQWNALAMLLSTLASLSFMHIPMALSEQILTTPFAYADGGENRLRNKAESSSI
jgi:Met-zincin